MGGEKSGRIFPSHEHLFFVFRASEFDSLASPLPLLSHPLGDIGV